MKVAIIGTGYISTFHAAAYHKLGIEIAAVSDLSGSNYQSRKDTYGSAKFYDNPDDIFQDETIDAVDICTINSGHYDLLVKAINRGKHIFCEKTLTESETKSADIVQRLKGFKKNFQIGYMKRFFPATKKALELIPEIGDIFSVHAKSFQGNGETAEMIYNNAGWKPENGHISRTQRWASGGMLNMGGSHLIDLLGLFLGNPESIYCLNYLPNGYDAEVDSHVLMRMKNDAVVHLETCVSPYSRFGFRQDGWDEVLEFNGKTGKISIYYTKWDNSINNAPYVSCYSEKTKTVTDFTFPKIDVIFEEINHFVTSCTSGTKSCPGANEGYYVDWIIDACYKSAVQKNTIAVKTSLR